jgi:hypothetical protein
MLLNIVYFRIVYGYIRKYNVINLWNNKTRCGKIEGQIQRLMLYKTAAGPTGLYRFEIWTVTTIDLSILQAAEVRVIRSNSEATRR